LIFGIGVKSSFEIGSKLVFGTASKLVFGRGWIRRDLGLIALERQ
jgi:hypothetical protein